MLSEEEIADEYCRYDACQVGQQAAGYGVSCFSLSLIHI